MRQISISLSLLLLAVCVCFPWHRAVFTRPEISLKNMKMREREGKEGGRADCYAALVSFGGANRRGRLPHLAINAAHSWIEIGLGAQIESCWIRGLCL